MFSHVEIHLISALLKHKLYLVHNGFSNKVPKMENTIVEPLVNKTVFWIFDHIRLKPACVTTETSLSHDIMAMETSDIIL